MRRFFVGCLLGVLFATACGGGETGVSESDRAEAFRAFVRAAADEDGDRLWALLSERMKAQISKEQFTAPSVLRNLRDDYAATAEGPIALNVQLDEEASLVALEEEDGGSGARAAIVRLEEGDWRVQLTELDLGYGGDLEFGVNARPADRASIHARAWVDGQEGAVTRTEGSFEPMFRITPTRRLANGPHSAVAFVESGERSGAIAWTFDR